MLIIAGPCVIDERTDEIAAELARVFAGYTQHECYFKASYDKANRTGLYSYRGPGLSGGLEVLRRVKGEHGLRVLTDVHSVQEVGPVSRVVDMVQVPALLCRQTDLLMAAGGSGLPVNVKKGQFMAPWDMGHVVEKVEACGCERVVVTERGTVFGYNRLVVDILSIPQMRGMGMEVVLDCTHSLQLPGAGCGCSAALAREYAVVLGRVAKAAGADGVFFEVYPEPDAALCDGPNSLSIEMFKGFMAEISA